MTKEEEDKLKVETDKMSKDLDDLKAAKPGLSDAELLDEFKKAQIAPDPNRIVSTHCQVRHTFTAEMLDAAFAHLTTLKAPKAIK